MQAYLIYRQDDDKGAFASVGCVRVEVNNRAILFKGNNRNLGSTKPVLGEAVMNLMKDDPVPAVDPITDGGHDASPPVQDHTTQPAGGHAG